MSRLELDDQILNHTKFVRAVRLGGAETVFAWLGIRAYVGQNLSDGFVPADMVDELRGPQGKKREAAIKTLCEVGLLHAVTDGIVGREVCSNCAERTAVAPLNGSGLLMHDYLQWSRSKSRVLADRAKARDRQCLSRGKSRRDIVDPSGGGSGASTTTTTSPPTSSPTTPLPPVVVADGEIAGACPVPLPLDDEAFQQLELDVGMPRHVAEKALRSWASDQAATKLVRHLETWIRWGLRSIRGQWTGDKAGMLRAAELPKPSTRQPPEEPKWL